MPITTDEAIEMLEAEPAADPASELGIRQLMLQVRANQANVERLKELLAMITAQYRAEIQRYEQKIGEAKEMIHRWLMTSGQTKLRFPDVGTAYLTTRGESVDLRDAEAFQSYARQIGILAQLQTVSLDTAAAKAWALERIRADGEIPPGMEVVPARQVLALRF